MAAPGILDALRAQLDGDPRVDAAYLFGSARGEAMRPDSDVDVAIRWTDAAAAADARREVLALLGRLGRAVGRDVHLVDLSSAGPELRRRAYEGDAIVDRDPRRTRDERVRAAREVIDWEYARSLRHAALRAQLSTADG